MALTKEYRFIGFIFFFLGTVSCTQDAKETASPTISQPYQMMVQNSVGHEQSFDSLRDLALGSLFQVRPSASYKQRPFVIRMQSLCSSDAFRGQLYYDVRFNTIYQFSPLNMISKEALSLTEGRPLVCDFEISITEQQTSMTHIYQLKHIQLTDSANFNNVSFFSERQRDYEFETIKNELLPIADAYFLRCTDFQKNMTNIERPTWADLASGAAQDQSLWSTSNQLCRFYAVKNENVFLSRPFRLLFRPRPLVIESSFSSLGGPVGLLSSRPVIHFHVTNPNAYAVRVKAENLAQNQYIFRPMYSTGNPALAKVGTLRTTPLHFNSVTTDEVEQTEESSAIFTIHAGETLDIAGTAQLQIDCTGLPLEQLPRQHYDTINIYTVFVGLNYAFELNLALKIQIGDEAWLDLPLDTTALRPIDSLQLPLWDLYIPDVKKLMPRDGTSMVNLTTNEDYLNTLNFNQTKDRCR